MYNHEKYFISKSTQNILFNNILNLTNHKLVKFSIQKPVMLSYLLHIIFIIYYLLEHKNT